MYVRVFLPAPRAGKLLQEKWINANMQTVFYRAIASLFFAACG
jgi:hypothetical protein